MNGNRMKYASTPTYGMQKRGFQKKAAEKQPPAPDFTQAPEQAAQPLVPPTGFMPAQGAVPNAPLFTQTGANPFAPVPMGMPGMPAQQTNPFLTGGAPQYGGMPGAMGAPYSYGATPLAQGGMMNPLMGQPGANPPPLQRQTPEPKQSAPFSPRAQGYIPPQQPVATNRTIPANSFQTGSAPMGAAGPNGIPAQQTFAPLPYNNPALGANPYLGMGGAPNPGMPVSGMPTTGMPGMPGGYPPDMNYPGYAQATPQRKPFNAALLVKALLFGVLPMLLLLGMVIPALSVLRYVFVGLAVISVAALWGLQMFQQSTRSAVTIVFVALCCLALFGGNGNADVQQTSANGSRSSTPEPNAVISVDTTAAPAPTAAPPQVEVLGASDAELRLSTFMDFWSTSRVEDMVSYVQPSWATLQDSPAKELFNLLSNRTPLDYSIEAISGTSADSSRTVTMSATIDKNNGKEPVTYRFMILMIKEDGNWYVDPHSLATNDVVTENPDATPTVGNMTAAPRTTVTPTPAPDTLLYYNPDGGSYYHADANCPSVKEEYLPLPGSFPYSDLASHKSLFPCLQCGAPTE